MKALVPYLFFNDNCREAMTFYKDCFGGELQLMTYADMPDDACPEGKKPDKDKIMHSFLKKGDFSLMASDMPEDGQAQGDRVQVYVECDSIPEVETLFKVLSEGGKIKMPLADTFWGSHFGILTDKFGMHWMLSCMLKK